MNTCIVAVMNTYRVAVMNTYIVAVMNTCIVTVMNYFELDFDFDFCKKGQKPGPFYGKARKNFAKVKIKIEK